MGNKLRYSGLAAVIIEYAAIIYFLLITKQPLKLSATISDFGAIDSTRLVFSLAIMSAAVLFILFGVWLYKKLKLKRNFMIAFFIGATSQVLLSWLPNMGKTAVWHYVFAIVVMITMPIVIYYYSQAVKNNLARSLSRGILGCQVLSLVLFPISIAWHVPLIPEAVTSIAFQSWAILATFKSS